MRKVMIVPLVRKEEMRRVFSQYLTELAEFDPTIEFDEKGMPIYNWFDCYWVDKDRFPFFFMVDEKVAGIAMIRELEPSQYDFAEFYVCPEQRKNGNALWFANEITNLFDGEFVFSTRFTNPRAIKFWGKFADSFESNSCYDDEVWRNWTIRKRNFKEHTLNLHPTYFKLIKEKIKTLEGRLNGKKHRGFKIGDYITFYKEPEKVETIKAIILAKYIFKDFDEMANTLSKAELGFADVSKEEMVKVYRTIYKRDDEEKHGVVIFKIQVLD